MLTEKYLNEVSGNVRLYLTKQGQPFLVRPLMEGDLWLVADLLGHLSRETLFLRFMTPYPPLTPEAALERALRLWVANPQLVVAMLATAEIEGEEQAIGIGEVNRCECAAPVTIHARPTAPAPAIILFRVFPSFIFILAYEFPIGSPLCCPLDGLGSQIVSAI